MSSSYTSGRRQRHKSSSKISSVRKRPKWLHDAIDFKRDPFTSGYCYSFKDRTTSDTSEARAWSDAAHRIDEQRRRTLEKKRVRHRHLATFRAMQRETYDSQFDDDMTVGGGVSSSIQYVPATRSGVSASSRVATATVRNDVAGLLGELRSRPPPPSTTAAAPHLPTSQQQHGSVISTPAGGSRSNVGGLRFSDLRKQQGQQQRQQDQQQGQQSREQNVDDPTLTQLAEARQRLDAMEQKGKSRVTFKDSGSLVDDSSLAESSGGGGGSGGGSGESGESGGNAEYLAMELERVQGSLEAAEKRIESEVALRVHIEATQKTLAGGEDAPGNSSAAPSAGTSVIPLQEVVKERESRKVRFDAMLGQLERKHEQEKERAHTNELKLNAQIQELVRRLEASEKKIDHLTQAQREKDREFQGRETT